MNFDVKTMTVQDATALAALATTLIAGATKLGFVVSDIIRQSKIDDPTIEDLIKRIEDAQASVPKWE